MDTAEVDDLTDLGFGDVSEEQQDYLIKQLNGLETTKIMIGKSVTKGLKKLRSGGQRVGKGAIILDTGSKITLFKDRFGRITSIWTDRGDRQANYRGRYKLRCRRTAGYRGRDDRVWKCILQQRSIG